MICGKHNILKNVLKNILKNILRVFIFVNLTKNVETAKTLEIQYLKSSIQETS